MSSVMSVGFVVEGQLKCCGEIMVLCLGGPCVGYVVVCCAFSGPSIGIWRKCLYRWCWCVLSGKFLEF